MNNTISLGKNGFFQRTHHPYYIVAPAFRQTSAGIRALHYLCHILNESGYEAYVTAPPEQTSPYLRTPMITPEIMRQHDASGVVPIGIYPEVASGNPLNLPVVARWALNKPGHLGGDSHYPETDLVFHYRGVILDGISSDRLDMPLVDRRIFHKGEIQQERKGFCYYAGKYLHFQHKISSEVLSNPNGTSLAINIPRTHQEIADILRASEVFYTYEPSTIIYEALACGCAVAYIENPYLDQFIDHLDSAEIIIPRINESEIGSKYIPKIDEAEIEKFLSETEFNAKVDIENLIQKTQAKACDYAEQTIAKSNPLLSHQATKNKELASTYTKEKNNKNQVQAHRSWLAQRENILQKYTAKVSETSHPPHFHIISRLRFSEMGSFANTLDSLAAQTYSDWVLDVFSEIPVPEGLDDIPCIHWHPLGQDEASKEKIAQRIEEARCDWIIEIPAGIKFDPLYLWRIANSASEHPNTKAFFVDDDCYSDDDSHTAPRFKPGCNPSALLSSDLAGVLCVRREDWLALPGNNEYANSNFALLLGISSQFGWNSIKHIPDILLSYPDTFSPNFADCKMQLHAHFQQMGVDVEVLYTGKQSWCIRPPLPLEPRVTISIISEGNYELLSRCLESIIALTQYKNFEILISLKSDDAIPDIIQLLREQEDKSRISIQPLINSVDNTYAKRCNFAVDRINSEFIVFLREEAQVIQETWLGELVRTATEDKVAAVMPRLLRPGSAQIENIGYVLGMNSTRGVPYQGVATVKDEGYLDYIQLPRDISLLPHACYLIKKQSYLRVGGMDASNFPDHWADADLSMRLRENGDRLICQPLANLVSENTDKYNLPKTVDEIALSALNKNNQENSFIQRWWPNAAADPFWNSNLSLIETHPTPEARYLADWQIIPQNLPRILARPLINGQGYFRITAPLTALQQTGRVQACVWNQLDGEIVSTPSEIIRLAPDSLILQHYMTDERLESLARLHSAPGRPFTVYAMDDLLDGLAETNPFRPRVPPNPKARLKFSFAHCDRLVVSTEFLAETYQHLIRDIRVVPNRLAQAAWLPLQSTKRAGTKPRIGWAGGVTHQDDLLLLKEIIEKTRDEADWVFMGMCPNEIRPLLSEFHELVNMVDYPAYLASLNLDIAVAPLAEIPFNRGKSNLRLLEYGILGIPVVCTDIDPYRNSPACCVPNSPQAWIDALRERIHDADAREAEGLTMRRWVCDHYLLEDHLDEWLNAHLPPGYSNIKSSTT
ncbi:glycosyltransferase [Azonexus sp.]|uniref:glycosyltransferase n=1 Tax=Azonexus sp. TaxID=1872668 RepID=UPI0027B8AAB3|nr:glycosyltransferase [Azonexus sp.]